MDAPQKQPIALVVAIMVGVLSRFLIAVPLVGLPICFVMAAI
jgi:hypothetical protein